MSVKVTRKRLYRCVAIGADPVQGGFRLLLAGRPLRSPAGIPLRLPTAALAAAVANEWLAQGEVIRPETMPMTRLTATFTDRIAPQRRAVIDALVAYVATDLLCYRGEAPAELVARQHALWQPLLDWAEQRWGARLLVGAGVLPVAQSADTIATLRRAVEAISDAQLTALACAVPVCGSLIIGLALLEDRIDAQRAFEAAQLDERWQAERWGIDAEAERRRREIADELRATQAFLSLCRAA